MHTNAHGTHGHAHARALLQILCPGLAQHNGEPHLLDSIDGLLVVFSPGSTPTRTIVGVEVKTRTKEPTAEKERERCRARPQIMEKYTHVDATSPRFRRCVYRRHEAVQLLHHAYTYSLDVVLLLVGEEAGIICGYWVSFPPSLRRDYGLAMHDIYRSSVMWAYDPTVDVPRDAIAAAIDRHSHAVDMETFDHALALRRSLSEQPYPLSPCRRLWSMPVGLWNVGKGGSDVASRLCNNIDIPLPFRGSQAIAFARTLKLIFIDIHRVWQLASAKPLHEYGSLEQYRDAANHRAAIWKTLVRLSRILIATADRLDQPASSSAIDTADNHPTTKRGRNSSRVATRSRDHHSIHVGSSPLLGTPPKKQRHTGKFCLEGAASERAKKCLGPAVHLTDASGRVLSTNGRCKRFGCDRRTGWFCLGCNTHYCNDSDHHKKKDQPVFDQKTNVLKASLYLPFEALRALEASSRVKLKLI